MVITRGYTFHEQLDSVDLIHMNGRVYDPEIGRFLSADPFVQDVTNSQSLNAYAYVGNNPLSYTDPSGFFLSGFFKAIGNFFKSVGRLFASAARAIVKSGIGRAIIQIIACATPGVNAVACVAVGAALTLAAGGTVKQALIGAAMSFASMGAFTGIHGIIGGIANKFLAGVVKIGLHAVVGGAMSVAQGGSFETGALTGAISAGASLAMDSSGLMGHSGDGIPENVAARTAVAAVAGGTASVLSGGKFANGAITGAFAQLYNADGGSKAVGAAMMEVGGSFIWGVGELQDISVMVGSGHSAGERIFAGVSLVANVLTGGFLPNAGGFIRAAGHLCSFEGDTRVETKRGRVAIMDLKPGDQVLARDDKTGQMAFKAVKHRFLNKDPDTTRVTMRDRATGATQTIVTTSNHPFYVADVAMPELRLVANGGAILEPGTAATGRWVEAGQLRAGERLINSAGSFSEVVNVTVEDTPLDAYNLEVETFHTFFVASPDNDNAPSVWVHNSCLSWLPEGQRQLAYDALERINRGDVDGLNAHVYGNREGLLPKGVDYTTHYVGDGANRFRIITGTDGSKYFSGSHYDNITLINGKGR